MLQKSSSVRVTRSMAERDCKKATGRVMCYAVQNCFSLTRITNAIDSASIRSFLFLRFAARRDGVGARWVSCAILQCRRLPSIHREFADERQSS